MVLAGGVGERLYPLTKERAKPAVYFGGPYRIIDFTLSNCINSGLRRDLHRAAVQVAVAQPPHPHGLERRRRRARRVRRDPQPAEARRRALVSRHGRRRLPEPLFDPSREPAVPDRAVGRSRLQDGLRADAALPSGARRRRRRSRSSRCRRKRRTGSACCRPTTDDRITGFLEKPQEPAARRAGARLDGDLHLRHGRAGAGARGRRAAARATTTSARTSSRR